MCTKPPQDGARTWFHRSLALTLIVGACLLILFAIRPGYGAFFVTSTLACVLAGFLWSPGDPPQRGLSERAPRRTSGTAAPFTLARNYRISAAR